MAAVVGCVCHTLHHPAQAAGSPCGWRELGARLRLSAPCIRILEIGKERGGRIGGPGESSFIFFTLLAFHGFGAFSVTHTFISGSSHSTKLCQTAKSLAIPRPLHFLVRDAVFFRLTECRKSSNALRMRGSGTTNLLRSQGYSRYRQPHLTTPQVLKPL